MSPASQRRASFAAVLVPYAALVWRFNFVCDDAFISFRYARNFAEGVGLRYNLGVEPPVEGYTNFLWVVWCSLFERAGWDVTVAARVTSVLCGVLTLALVMRFAERRLALAPPKSALPALLLACLPPFAVWSTGGLATLPFTLALFASYERLVGDPERPRPAQAAAAASLAVLLRADGVFFVGAALGMALVTALRERRTSLPREVVAAGLVAAAVAAAHLAFRVAYYGDWLPNTAYAKVGFSPFALTQGASYVAAMALAFPALALAPLASLGFAVARRSAAALELGVIPFLVAAYVAIVAGGDFMAMARLLVPALPFVALSAVIPLRAGEKARGPAALAWPALLLVLSILPAWGLHALPDSIRYRLRFRVPITMSELDFWKEQCGRTERWTRIGRALTWFTAPGESLVAEPIGAIGYHSRLFIHDTFGLVTREVARRPPDGVDLSDPYRPPGHHKKVRNAFFLPAHPDYLEALIVAGRDQPLEAPGYHAVYHPLPEHTRGRGERFLYLLKRDER